MFKNKLIVIGIVILLSLIYIKEVDAFTGCTLGTGGQPGCINVANWGSTNINQVVKNAAKANPGTTYMAWCAYTGATPKAGSVRAACDCPDLNPAPGTCQTDYCGACGNPVTKCAPGTPPPPPPTCTDECVTGQKMCSGNNLLVCGNFDNDKCTEWGIKKDCSSIYKTFLNK